MIAKADWSQAGEAARGTLIPMSTKLVESWFPDLVGCQIGKVPGTTRTCEMTLQQLFLHNQVVDQLSGGQGVIEYY